jgi:hypothetical protein
MRNDEAIRHRLKEVNKTVKTTKKEKEEEKKEIC